MGNEKEGAYSPQKRRKWEKKERRKIFGLRQNIWNARKKKLEKERVEKILAGKNIWRKKNHMTKLSSLITLLKRLRKLIEEYC